MAKNDLKTKHFDEPMELSVKRVKKNPAPGPSVETLSEEEREKILKLIENEPEVSINFKSTKHHNLLIF